MVIKMDYMRVISSQGKTDKCVHGLEKEICGFCNGSFYQKKERKMNGIIDKVLEDKYLPYV